MEGVTIFGWDLGHILNSSILETIIRFAVLLLIGIPGIFFLSRWTRKQLAKRYTAHHGMIGEKIIFWGGLFVIGFSLLNELGFKLTHLLGAAGVLGIAIGFASQTSVSNVISGLFLMAERPFVVNDVITIGETTGQVLSIDTLSVKLRTFDNKFVRIPNETIVKSEVTNITYFPIRRVDVNIGVAYKEDIRRVRTILLEIARANPICLREPEPTVLFSGFGTSSIDLLFAVWATKEDWLKLKNGIQEEIKRRFEQEGIEIPFPHLSLYTGEATKPFPIRSGGEKD